MGTRTCCGSGVDGGVDGELVTGDRSEENHYVAGPLYVAIFDQDRVSGRVRVREGGARTATFR